MNTFLIQLIEAIADVEGNPTKIQIGYTINNMCHHDGFVILASNGAVLDIVELFIKEFHSNFNSKGMIMCTINEENKGLLITMTGDK